jgi:lipid-binding SYLF domain-containing protein
MSPAFILRKIPAALVALLLSAFFAPLAIAMSTPELERAAAGALSHLYARNSKAADIGRRSVASLVFPDAHMVGAGVAVQSGTGVLFYKGNPQAYFNLSGVSAGLELGIQKFDVILFFEDDAALDKLYHVGGFALSTAPTLVVFDGIIAGKVSTTSIRSGVHAFLSGQQGLMLSLGLGKTKLTEFVPERN